MIGGAAIATGVIVYLWPRAKSAPVVAATPDGGCVGYSLAF